MEEVKSRQEVATMISEANQKLFKMLDNLRSDITEPGLMDKVEVLCAEYRSVGFFEGQLHLLDFIADDENITPSMPTHETKQTSPTQTETKTNGPSSHSSNNRRYF